MANENKDGDQDAEARRAKRVRRSLRRMQRVAAALEAAGEDGAIERKRPHEKRDSDDESGDRKSA